MLTKTLIVALPPPTYFRHRDLGSKFTEQRLRNSSEVWDIALILSDLLELPAPLGTLP